MHRQSEHPAAAVLAVAELHVSDVGTAPLQGSADPGQFALIVAICASNAFIIPTHQVNALIMGPGGYRVNDYLRVGSVMTGIFLVVASSVASSYCSLSARQTANRPCARASSGSVVSTWRNS